MTWASYHRESEAAAAAAEVAARSGSIEKAVRLYAAAADAETRALDALDASKVRTLGITAVSAVALWYKAKEYGHAEQMAHHWLGTGALPRFATEQVRTLLQTVWTTEAAERSGVGFVPGDVLVSIKGGKVVFGGAPLDLIVRKVEEVQAVFFRTAELLLGLPLRRRGGPSQDLQATFQPWLFQVPAGSYQFAIRVQEPPQVELFPNARPRVEQVTRKFLEIIQATAHDPAEKLNEVVPDRDYRAAFLKLARNLAPTGKAFDHLEIRDASAPATRPTYLGVAARAEINATIRKERQPSLVEDDGNPAQLSGVLRAVHLDQDWIELAVPGLPEAHTKVFDVGELLDDVLGPLVNRRVIVTVLRKPTGRLSIRDIEAED